MNRLKAEDRKCSFKAEDSYSDDANTKPSNNKIPGCNLPQKSHITSDFIKRTGIDTSFDEKVVSKGNISKLSLAGQLKHFQKIREVIKLYQETLVIVQGWEMLLLSSGKIH